MDKNERFREIIGLLQKNRKVNVNELALRFGTSPMTIRRDLNELADQYNIVRTHGGAMIGDQTVVRMISFDEEKIPHRDEKVRIAREAAKLIRSGQCVYIDSGSTTRILLDYLNPDTEAVIVCNHLGVAQQALGFEHLRVIMLGGEMIRGSNCSSGTVAREQIMKLPLDAAFIGAAAISDDGTLSDGFSPEAEFKSVLFDSSYKGRLYLMADSSKIGKNDFHFFGHLRQIDTAIIDSGIDQNGIHLMKRYDVHLITV